MATKPLQRGYIFTIFSKLFKMALGACSSRTSPPPKILTIFSQRGQSTPMRENGQDFWNSELTKQAPRAKPFE